jgi:hypothetical protein
LGGETLDQAARATLFDPFFDDRPCRYQASNSRDAARDTSNDGPPANYQEPFNLDRSIFGVLFKQPNFSLSGVFIGKFGASMFESEPELCRTNQFECLAPAFAFTGHRSFLRLTPDRKTKPLGSREDSRYRPIELLGYGLSRMRFR